MTGRFFRAGTAALLAAAHVAAAGAYEASASGLDFAAQGVERCLARQGELQGSRVVYIEQEPQDGEGVALTACGLIDAAAAEVWPVLRDCESYEHFLPGVERSALQSRNGDVAFCEALIDLPFPLGDLRSLERVTETKLAGGGFERRWSLESGSYRRLEGSWTLLPQADGQHTLAVYQLDMDPETVVPDFVLRRAQSSTAPGVFEAIRERVRRRETEAVRGNEDR